MSRAAHRDTGHEYPPAVKARQAHQRIVEAEALLGLVERALYDDPEVLGDVAQALERYREKWARWRVEADDALD